MNMKEIIERLIKLNKTISTMESCTGGGVVNEITNIPGASEVLKFSAVTYSNEFYIKMHWHYKTSHFTSCRFLPTVFTFQRKPFFL